MLFDHLFTTAIHLQGLDSSSSSIQETLANDQSEIKSSLKSIVTGILNKRSAKSKQKKVQKFLLSCTKEIDNTLKCKPIAKDKVDKKGSSSHVSRNNKQSKKSKHKRSNSTNVESLHQHLNISNAVQNVLNIPANPFPVDHMLPNAYQNSNSDQNKNVTTTLNHLETDNSNKQFATNTKINTNNENVNSNEKNNDNNHNVGLDLNKIMSSVMARRHEYLQQQIEDGILDTANYDPSSGGEERYADEDDVDDGLIDMKGLPPPRYEMTSTAATTPVTSVVSNKNNNVIESKKNDSLHMLTQFIENALQGTTPLLVQSPNGVQSGYKNTQKEDPSDSTKNIVYSNVVQNDMKQLIAPTKIKTNIETSNTEIKKILFTGNNTKNNFFNFEFHADESDNNTEEIPEDRDNFRVFKYSSYNAAKPYVESTLSFHDNIQTTMLSSTAVSRIVKSILPSAIASASAGPGFTPVVDGINGLFETGIEYFPIPLDSAEEMLFGNNSTSNSPSISPLISFSNSLNYLKASIQVTPTYSTISNFRASSTPSTQKKSESTFNSISIDTTPQDNPNDILDDYICEPENDVDNSEFNFFSKKKHINPAPTAPNAARVYDEFVSAYQKVSGNAEIDLSEDAEDILSSNIAHDERDPSSAQSLSEFNKNEERSFGSWSSLGKARDREDGYSLPSVFNDSSSPTQREIVVTPSDDDLAKSKKDDFFLLKRNNISTPGKSVGTVRRCHYKKRRHYTIIRRLDETKSSTNPMLTPSSSIQQGVLQTPAISPSSLIANSIKPSKSLRVEFSFQKVTSPNKEESTSAKISNATSNGTKIKSADVKNNSVVKNSSDVVNNKDIIDSHDVFSGINDVRNGTAIIVTNSSDAKSISDKIKTTLKPTSKTETVSRVRTKGNNFVTDIFGVNRTTFKMSGSTGGGKTPNEKVSYFPSPTARIHPSTTDGKGPTSKGTVRSEWRFLGKDSNTNDICGKNFIIQMKLPADVHRFSKTEIKSKIEDNIGILYREHNGFKSSKVVWVDDVSSDNGPSVGVDLELYFDGKSCNHLGLLQRKLTEGWIGEIALYNQGILYGLLDDRITDSPICSAPCSNPYNCYPKCERSCCENPLLIIVPPTSLNQLKKNPQSQFNYAMSAKTAIHYPTPSFNKQFRPVIGGGSANLQNAYQSAVSSGNSPNTYPAAVALATGTNLQNAYVPQVPGSTGGTLQNGYQPAAAGGSNLPNNAYQNYYNYYNNYYNPSHPMVCDEICQWACVEGCAPTCCGAR